MKIIAPNLPANQFRMLVPFTKFEKTDDGRLMLEGIATSEALDHAGEIVDYASAKAAFAEWTGNIREQHDVKKAVGRALEVVADDATKTIRVKAFISKGAPDTQAKIMDGTLTCYSIGGSVKERKTDKAKKADGTEVDALRIFVEKLTETSVVDEGCNPETAFSLVKMVGDQLVGVGVEDAAEPLDVTGSADDVAAFAKALNDAGLTMADATALIKAKEPAKVVLIDKSMWNVQDFASALSSLSSIARGAQYDLDYEGDNSPVPAKLRAWIAGGVAIFKEMATEEADELVAELAAAAGENVLEMALAVSDLKKRLADPALTMGDFAKLAGQYLSADEVAKITPASIPQAKEAILGKASAKMSAANVDRLQAAHDHIAAMGATCASAKAAPAGDLAKAQGDEVATLKAELATALTRLKKLEDQPVPHVMLKAVQKTLRPTDATPTPDKPAAVELTKADYIYGRDGAIDYNASIINKRSKLALAEAGK